MGVGIDDWIAAVASQRVSQSAEGVAPPTATAKSSAAPQVNVEGSIASGDGLPHFGSGASLGHGGATGHVGATRSCAASTARLAHAQPVEEAASAWKYWRTSEGPRSNGPRH